MKKRAYSADSTSGTGQKGLNIYLPQIATTHIKDPVRPEPVEGLY
jgi:hypothetical protein